MIATFVTHFDPSAAHITDANTIEKASTRKNVILRFCCGVSRFVVKANAMIPNTTRQSTMKYVVFMIIEYKI